jgi:ceramide glucosyltransferase
MELSLRILSRALVTVIACGIAYLIAAIAAALRARGRYVPAPKSAPPVTLLKPLHGLETGLFENLCSFCEQEYPSFQAIFGVQRPDDPAVDLVHRVIACFPNRDLALVVANPAERPKDGDNPKIANVANMIGLAKHDLLIITDSDMRVGPGYLSAVVAEFDDPNVGAATCLYSGMPCGGLASRLAAMQMDEQFAPSVLVATLLQPLAFCFGSTMAVRRSVLEEIGGIDALRSHLADDYRLGALVRARGYRVALSPYVVSNAVDEENLSSLWHHELRWARIIRSVRPTGFAMSFVTFPFPFTLLLALVPGQTVNGLTLCALVLALRFALHLSMRGLLSCHPGRGPLTSLRTGYAKPKDRNDVWLIPFRDLLGFAIWAASFFGRSVRWRDRELRS